MKKLILIGRSEAGKTTLTQALRGQKIHYEKTQYITYGENLIDTPGEYAENAHLAHALALYSYEADVVGLLLSATEPYSLYAPNITCMANREVIGIITKADHKDARVDLARLWLENAGCDKIFVTSSYNHDGIDELMGFLTE
jgi:ethanolamine utilization protein EutP